MKYIVFGATEDGYHCSETVDAESSAAAAEQAGIEGYVYVTARDNASYFMVKGVRGFKVTAK